MAMYKHRVIVSKYASDLSYLGYSGFSSFSGSRMRNITLASILSFEETEHPE